MALRPQRRPHRHAGRGPSRAAPHDDRAPQRLPRRTPVQYERIDGEIVLVAAAGGAPADPAWLRNLLAEPRVHVRIGRRQGPAVASVAAEGKRSRLWPELCARNPALTGVARRAHRAIPLVILRTEEWAPFGP